MKIKRILATLLVACMIFSILPASVLADGACRVFIDPDVSVDAGGSVKLNLNVENNPGITALTVRVFYKTLTCTKISYLRDKDNQSSAYAEWKNSLDEEAQEEITAQVVTNTNNTERIPEDRKNDGWRMAWLGYAIGDNAGKGRSFDKSGTIASLEFSAPADMETSDVVIELEELTLTDSKDNEITIAGSTSKIHVNGVAPTIGTISIDPEAATTTYASGDEFTLSATSVKGTTITDLVNFTITKDGKDYTKNMGFIVDEGTLKVKSVDPASVGKYTITATSLDETKCKNPETPVTATFTITPATITSAKVEITGFGKGQTAADAKAKSKTDGLSCGAIMWTETDTTFVGGKSYTASIPLTIDSNYTLKEGFSAEDITVTAAGTDGSTIVKELKEENGQYTLILTLTAEAKTRLNAYAFPAPVSTAEYGTRLKDVAMGTQTAGVMLDVDNNPVDGAFTWKLDEYEENVTVGDVTDLTVNQDGTPFKALFTPTRLDLYDPAVVTAYVIVTKRQIDVSAIGWKTPTTFAYDGNEHKVELDIPNTLTNDITVKYDDTQTAKDVGEYSVTATIGVVNSTNCEIKGENTPKTLTWHITKGTLNLSNKEFNAYYQSASVDKTLAELGLSDLADEPELSFSFASIENTVAAKQVRTVKDATGKITSIFIELYDNCRIGETVGVRVTVSSKNYENAEFNVLIKLEDKAEDTTSMTVSVADITYGETPAPQVEGKPDETSDLTYKYVRTDLAASPTYDGETIKNAPAGKYELTVTCEDATTYYIATDTFEIKPREITANDVSFGKTNLVYTGESQTQTVIVKIGDTTLTAGTDYTVSGADLTQTEPNTYTVTITGTGNYNGTVTVSFEIKKAPLSSVTISGVSPEYTYTGEAQEPLPTLTFNSETPLPETLVKDTDYTLSYSNNTNVGTATITITAKADSDHFTGETTTTFEITKVSFDSVDNNITVEAIPDQVYSAQPLEPAVTVKFGDRTLVKGTDYTVAYANNTNVSGGTLASVTITGIGNFTGEKQANFKINPANLNLSNKNITHVYTDSVNQTYTVPADMFLADEKEANKGFTITGTSLTYAVTEGKDVLSGNPTVSDNTISYTLKGTLDALGTVAVEVPVHATCGNYKDGTFLLYITVTDKTNVSNNIHFPDGTRTYTGSGIEYKAATLNGNSITKTYTYEANANTGASLTTGGLPLTVGTYTVTVNYEDSKSIGSKTATLTIVAATPTEPKPVEVTGPGLTLGDLEDSMLDDIGIKGTIYWYDSNGNQLSSSTTIEPNTEYTWKFVPEDKNYSEITGKFTPYVDKISYLPAVIGGNTGSFNFRDVSRTDYYYNAVKWAAENGIASGTSSRTFSPDAVCTRAQTVTFLWRAAGSPLPRYRVNPFTDVTPYDYYYNAVLWAVEEGITTGLTATTFGPDATVTRGQVATFLYRAASAAKPNTFNPFTDVKSSAYNYDAILWAYDNSITTGTSTTTFSPDAFCTRAQIVTFLYRFYQGR